MTGIVPELRKTGVLIILLCGLVAVATALASHGGPPRAPAPGATPGHVR